MTHRHSQALRVPARNANSRTLFQVNSIILLESLREGCRNLYFNILSWWFLSMLRFEKQCGICIFKLPTFSKITYVIWERTNSIWHFILFKICCLILIKPNISFHCFENKLVTWKLVISWRILGLYK